jgi:hypothetical protein
MKLQPVNRRDGIVAECPGAYLRQSRTQYILVVEGINNTRFWSRRKVNFAMALEKANARLEELQRPSNPLGIMCAECFRLCVLSKDGKRWLCQCGHGNERIRDEQL